MSKYVLAMGGAGDGASNVVDVFKVTNSGVEHITDYGFTLSQGRYHLASASCGNYILAMGGMSSSGGSISDAVDVFKVTNSGVEKITGHNLTLSEGRFSLAAASCGNYILAMGGYSGRIYSDVVDVFKVTASGVEHITDHNLTLSKRRTELRAASCGGYILALGGEMNGDISDAVDVFKVTDSNIEHITDHELKLSEARTDLAVASCGNYILAMGGYSGDHSSVVDVFKVTTSNVEHITDHSLALSQARAYLAAASCGDYILAMGGVGSSGGHQLYSDAVDVFKATPSGVEKIIGHGLTLSEGRYQLAAASCGNYILALGGLDSSAVGDSNVLDVFEFWSV